MRRIVSAALCAMVLLAAHVARARTFAFTLGSGSIDTAGFFGPVGGDHSGKIALITIDFPPGYMCATQGALGSYYWCNGNSHINPHLKTTVKVTINGQSQQQTMSSPQVQYLSGFRQGWQSALPHTRQNQIHLPRRTRRATDELLGDLPCRTSRCRRDLPLPGLCRSSLEPAIGRKPFFFEKKNQKTFDTLGGAADGITGC